MWLSTSPASMGIANTARPGTCIPVESLATRQANLQSMASSAVDIASSKGLGATSELHHLLSSFISKLTESGTEPTAVLARKPVVANPMLKKNQTQTRKQPIVGPTTAAAARQSRQRKATNKRKQKEAQRQKTAGF